MDLTLCRHGETQANLALKLTGWKHSPFSEKGKKQAKKVGEHLQSRKFDLAFSSDQIRAKKTAQAILSFHPGIRLHLTPLLRECHFGKWEGMTREQYTRLPEWEERAKHKFSFVHPGGESFKGVRARVKRFLEMLRSKFPGKRILVVGHSGSMLCLLNLLLERKPESMTDMAFPNTAVFFVRNRPGNVTARWVEVESGKTGKGVMWKKDWGH